MTNNQIDAERVLLNEDGENLAVRSFMMQYGVSSLTVGAMRKHMDRSGWPLQFCPEFARLGNCDSEHLTKAGAQIWIRHLLSMETPPAQGESALPELPLQVLIAQRDEFGDLWAHTAEQLRAYGQACRAQGDADKVDAARLDFVMEREAWIAWSKDGESCRLFHRSEDGEPMPMLGWGARHWSHDPREAIDAARAAIPAQSGGTKGSGK